MILCCGESLIDMVPQDGAFVPFAGGAVYNTAVALGRLGTDTAYLWPISQDQFGDMLRKPLEEADVNLSFCPSTPRLTTLAFVSLQDGQASYSFYDEGTAGRLFCSTDLPELPLALEALFIGGISLIQDPCGTTVTELAQRVRKMGIVVMVDLNIRPNLIANATEVRDRLNMLIGIADIIKFSDEDATWLYPGIHIAEIIKKIQVIPEPKLVLHTRGAEGATAIFSGGEITRAAEKITVADTIGAGDTFDAGFLTALSEAGILSKTALSKPDQYKICAALDLATHAAAATASRHGANPPWRAELSL